MIKSLGVFLYLYLIIKKDALMITKKLSLISGFIISLSLFGMDKDSILHRARGNSITVEVALKNLADSPVESHSRSPEQLNPQEIGFFDDEFEQETSETESYQGIVFTNIEAEKKQAKLSEADQCSDWRKAPRAQPSFETKFYHLQRPKKPVPGKIRPDNQHKKTIVYPKPLHSSVPSSSYNQAPAKKSYNVWTPQEQLSVIASAVKLCNRPHNSNNPFALLTEQEN